MRKIIILLFLGFTFGTNAQDNSQYMYGVVIGNATIYGEYNIFMYYTKISEVNCYISKSDAKSQMHQYFGNITNRWEGYDYIVNYFDSRSEAENFRSNAIAKAKEQAERSKKRLTKQSVRDSNVPMFFNCNN